MLSRILVIAVGLSLCFTPLFAGEGESETTAPAPEAVKAAPAQPDVSAKEVEPYFALILPMKGSYEQHVTAINQLQAYAMTLGLEPPEFVFGQYFNNPMQVTEEELLWEVGIPVPDGTEVEAPYEAKLIPGGLVAYVIHVGPYEESSAFWPAVYMWAGMNGYQPSGPAMEIWTGDPEKTGEEGPKTELRAPVTKPE
jgi:AraC family transcriptional regulator